MHTHWDVRRLCISTIRLTCFYFLAYMLYHLPSLIGLLVFSEARSRSPAKTAFWKREKWNLWVSSSLQTLLVVCVFARGLAKGWLGQCDKNTQNCHILYPKIFLAYHYCCQHWANINICVLHMLTWKRVHFLLKMQWRCKVGIVPVFRPWKL